MFFRTVRDECDPGKVLGNNRRQSEENQMALRHISSTDHEGRQFWVVAAEREDTGRFIERADEWALGVVIHHLKPSDPALSREPVLTTRYAARKPKQNKTPASILMLKKSNANPTKASSKTNKKNK